MENRVKLFFHKKFYRSLSNSIGYCWDPQNALLAIRLRDPFFQHRVAETHVPEHSRFQILYRLPSRCWSNIFKVCPSHPGLPCCDAHPDMMPRPVLLVFQRFSLHQLHHPLMGCVFCNECDPHPFAPDPLQIFHHYYEWFAPCFPIRAGNRFSRS